MAIQRSNVYIGIHHWLGITPDMRVMHCLQNMQDHTCEGCVLQDRSRAKIRTSASRNSACFSSARIFSSNLRTEKMLEPSCLWYLISGNNKSHKIERALAMWTAFRLIDCAVTINTFRRLLDCFPVSSLPRYSDKVCDRIQGGY